MRSPDSHPLCPPGHALAAPAGLSRRQLLGRGLALAGAALLPLGLGVPALAQRSDVEARLRELGIELPALPAAVANYRPYVAANGLLYIAGQIPRRDGEMLHPGRVPEEVSIEQGQEAARLCAINILAAVKEACAGDWRRVQQCLRLEGFVASSEGFNDQSQVVNGASDLMVEVLGERGRHSRIAVGVNELPLDACVEVAAVFALND